MQTKCVNKAVLKEKIQTRRYPGLEVNLQIRSTKNIAKLAVGYEKPLQSYS